MALEDFESRPSADGKQEDVEISEHAAISRLRPIQDGLDYWQEHRSSAAADSSDPAPGRCSDLVGRGSTRRFLIGRHLGISAGADGTLRGPPA
jgi:hypothetical protein